MKQILKVAALFFFTGIFLASCQKVPNTLPPPSPPSNPTFNQPPIARAGADQAITLPVNSVSLDGNSSSDPDNNITGYTWTKISGPSSFNISNANAAQTQINNLVQGVYLFELKVIDAGGLFSKDTMNVTVNVQPPPPSCDISGRLFVNAQLVPFGMLSRERSGLAIAGAGNKILIAGGYDQSNAHRSSRVDILDVSSNAWTTAELSIPRSYMASVAAGNKIFFAGGMIGNDSLSSRVDIYDVVTNSWTIAELSLARANMAASVAGNKVLFAGGYDQISETYGDYYSTNRIDIYDLTTNSWSTSVLSESRGDLTATAVGSKIYFAGGQNFFEGNDAYGTYSTRIDIYDVFSNSWSVSSLSEEKGFHAGISFNNKIYWGGGYNRHFGTTSSVVQILDANTNSSSLTCLSAPRAFFDAVEKDNRIVFFTGIDGTSSIHTRFDIYEPASDTWIIGVLDQDIYGTSLISVNNVIYVAGGYVNGVLSNKVWKLNF